LSIIEKIYNYFIAKQLNIVERSQKALNVLSKKSAKALDLVTATINSLDAINAEIQTTMDDIARHRNELQQTETALAGTRETNERIANRFRNLIEAE